jgi:predicted ATPase
MSHYRFTHISLKNWKNFKQVDVPLAQRVFVVGPNASGKSNLLLALRFLREIALEGGGLAAAVKSNHGLTALRSLHARGNSIEIKATIKSETGDGWRYELSFAPVDGERDKPVITSERVIEIKGGRDLSPPLLNRPDKSDDQESLQQTALLQMGLNRSFRDLVHFLRGVSYLHIVPQLLREQPETKRSGGDVDPFGRDLLDRIRQTPVKQQRDRLRRIEKVLQIVVPQLKQLRLQIDDHGRAHLECRFVHWRGVAARQNETQFSDGTLRFIGLLWSIQEPAGPLLLEEPELSLHTAIVRHLAPFIQRAQFGPEGRQVILSTHSEHLLANSGIAPEEILLVRPAVEGSSVECGAKIRRIKTLMQAGILASEAVIAETDPKQSDLLLEAVI